MYHPWYYPVSEEQPSLFGDIRDWVFGKLPINPGPDYRSDGYRMEELVSGHPCSVPGLSLIGMDVQGPSKFEQGTSMHKGVSCD